MHKEQLEMFETKRYHGYSLERHGKKTKAWVVPYHKESEWSGAWYRQEMDAIKFVSYINARTGELHVETHRQAEDAEPMGGEGDC